MGHLPVKPDKTPQQTHQRIPGNKEKPTIIHKRPKTVKNYYDRLPLLSSQLTSQQRSCLNNTTQLSNIAKILFNFLKKSQNAGKLQFNRLKFDLFPLEIT